MDGVRARARIRGPMGTLSDYQDRAETFQRRLEQLKVSL